MGDIRERKRTEERQRLLIGELNHLAHSTVKCNGRISGAEENLARGLVAEYLSGARVEFDPDPFPRHSLHHAVYAALLHFGFETASVKTGTRTLGHCPMTTGHRGAEDHRSVRTFAVKPRAFGAPLLGIGA